MKKIRPAKWIWDRAVDIAKDIDRIEHQHNVNMHDEFVRARHRGMKKPSKNIRDSHDRRP